ncbi:TPA: phage recombination protein Bet, partial [Streptococcus pneumoniae]|nr:phage recombination protein Bet [Streptococcus pneumoniae]
ESREDVVARKMAQIDQFNKEQEANHADPEPTQNEDPIQGELLDGELEY